MKKLLIIWTACVFACSPTKRLDRHEREREQKINQLDSVLNQMFTDTSDVHPVVDRTIRDWIQNTNGRRIFNVDSTGALTEIK